MNFEPLYASMNRFVTLSEEDKIRIKKVFTFNKYGKKEYLVKSGKICTHLTFVLSGYLKKTLLTEDGDERVLLFYKQGSWFVEMESFTQQIPAVYNIRCITDVEVLQISYDDLQQLYDDVPRVNSFFRILAERGLVVLSKRLLNGHINDAKTKYLNFLKDYPEHAQNVPQYLIASYLGVTKEFLSKLKHQLKQETLKS